MPASTPDRFTKVHDAREALARRLRELRKQAGMTGRELAESLSWPPSKVSKLENARQTPTDDDIRAWTRATDAERETDGLLAALHTLEVQFAEWQRLLRTGLRPVQRRIAELDAKTSLFRVFTPMVIPGIVQTAEYARTRLHQGVELFGAPDDIDAAVEARLKRQEMFYQRGKRFHLVLTEASLRFRLCGADAMLAQLDRLISLSALPNVRLGVIGFESEYQVGPWHGFWILDQDRVMVETYSAELNLTQPQEIELYGRVFESLASVASYGRAARKIITRAIDDLSAELPEDGG